MAASEHTTSTGHHLSTASWLDVHFDVCEPEYAALVNMAGFEPGWHVLDAGSGSGSYLKLLADRVGPDGKLTALDLAPENTALIEARLDSQTLAPPVDVAEGSILDLPFPDNTFDGTWCANVTMYLSDAELRQAITEFRRVIRPGGFVALKDYSIDLSTLKPIPYGYLERLVALLIEHTGGSWYGCARTWNLRSFLAEAGFEKVWQRSLISEHRAPLSPANHQLQADYLAFLAATALELDLPTAEQAFWQLQLDPAATDAIVNQPDFYHAEAQMLAIGRVSQQ